MKEEIGLNVFQLFEIKQSGVLEHLRFCSWHAVGTHMWRFGSSSSWETPRMRDSDWSIFFTLNFQRGHCLDRETSGLNYSSFGRTAGQMTQGILTEDVLTCFSVVVYFWVGCGVGSIDFLTEVRTYRHKCIEQ